MIDLTVRISQKVMDKSAIELGYIADEVHYLHRLNIFDNKSYKMALALKQDIKDRGVSMREAEKIHFAFYRNSDREDVYATLSQL